MYMRKGKLTEEERDLAESLYRDGYSTYKIGRILGCYPSSVGYVLKRRDVPLRERGAPCGEAHGNWKGGRSYHPDGYVIVSDQGRVVSEHRMVMEAHLGRRLLPGETVHHINGVRDDNRIENLQLRQGNHGPGVVFMCRDCGSRNVQATEV